MKKFVSIFCALALIFSLAACTSSNGNSADNGSENNTTANDSENAANENTELAPDSITVGVIQYASHGSLDNCYEGFVQGLAAAGYVEGVNLTIRFENANGETSTADTIAKNMVASGVDLICGIATPAAMSAYSATRNTDIPVIFCAVSDPVSSGLAESLDAPGGNATGTSDALNFDAQLALIRAFLPEATSIGILYTVSEPNSVAHLKAFEELAPSYGFTVESVGVSSASDVASGAQSLVAKGIDCVNNFTDNNVVDNLPQLLKAANDAGIPVFGSEIEQVINGCTASESLDYVALGNATGLMAAEVLGGASTADMSVQIVTDTSPVYNAAVAESLGISLPELDMEQVA